MLGAAFLLWAVLIWPVVLRFRLTVGSDFLPQGYLSFHTIGIALRMEWTIVRDKNGLDIRFRFAGKEGKAQPLKTYRSKGKDIRTIIAQDQNLRKNMTAYLQKLRIKTEIRIGLDDAAHTAIVCGIVSALMGAIPHVEAHIIPDFRKEDLCLQIKCISSFRVGKLLVSAAMYLRALTMEYVRQKAGGADHGKSASD